MACYTNVTELSPTSLTGGGWLFRWDDSYTGKLYQLYINGILAAETRKTSDSKQLIAQAAGKFSWQVIAIDPADAGMDFSDYLTDTDERGGRVRIRWPRKSSELEQGSFCNIYWDSGSGTINTVTSLNPEPILNFPPGAPAWGHGLGPHGYEAHGYEGLGIGHGYEAHGMGEHGFGCDWVEYITEQLEPGYYQFLIKVFDAAGNEDIAGGTTLSVLVDSYPPPPASIAIKSYDAINDSLVLTLTAAS